MLLLFFQAVVTVFCDIPDHAASLGQAEEGLSDGYLVCFLALNGLE